MNRKEEECYYKWPNLETRLDARYKRGVNSFFLPNFHGVVLMNPSHSSTLCNLIFLSCVNSITSYPTYECIHYFLFVILWLGFE
ncbi:hypothetical protein HanRHA438_Chr09g0422041 [Helianthus annuus]|nr:hypothetical protein HanIR_Chr09g0441871 [Helianthus annuus]KAJ0890280.1 hypothetical protein HanRHA438_Chr09g0422041 [Helianthus annuus]